MDVHRGGPGDCFLVVSLIQRQLPIVVIRIVLTDVVFWLVSVACAAAAAFLPAVKAMQDTQSVTAARSAGCSVFSLEVETAKVRNGLSLERFVGDGFNDALRIAWWSQVTVGDGT